jgi:hypothetical protein
MLINYWLTRSREIRGERDFSEVIGNHSPEGKEKLRHSFLLTDPH